MARIATTKMSSKGQVVIPEDVRVALGLEAGSQFVVIGEGDVVVLKKIAPPAMSDFDEILREARRHARHARMKRTDVTAAIKAARTSR